MKYSKLDSTKINYQTEELLSAAPNRYKITVRVARLANRWFYKEFEDMDAPLMKPVLRAIIEMSDDLKI